MPTIRENFITTDRDRLRLMEDFTFKSVLGREYPTATEFPKLPVCLKMRSAVCGNMQHIIILQAAVFHLACLNGDMIS